jgi:myo-inositol-1(or 4)-monophosphatase
MTEELYVAQKGRGAYLNNKRLHVSPVSDINLSIASTGFPYGRVEDRSHSLEQFNAFAAIGNPIRMIGSATISLAYVAAGKFDAFWSLHLSPWDVAAGKLLIEEAGGTVTHYDGKPHDMFKQRDILATNTNLHQEMLNYLI